MFHRWIPILVLVTSLVSSAGAQQEEASADPVAEQVAAEPPSAPVGAGEDEGGPVPSSESEGVVLRTPLAQPIGLPPAADPATANEPDVAGDSETDDDCGCERGDGGVYSPAAGPGMLPEGAAPCDCTAWMSDSAEDAPLLEMRRDPFSIAPRGMMQLVGVPWQGDAARMAHGAPADTAGFRFRRVRLGVEGELPFHFSYEIGGEFTADGAELLDANLAFRIPHLDVVAGAGKVPFSASMLTPAGFLTFLDRPFGVDGETPDGTRYGIAPGRMLGLELGTGVELGDAPSVLRLRAGVYNGNEDYFVGNDNEGMLYAVRLECLPLGDLPDGQLEVADGDPLLRVGGAYFFNDDAAGDWHAAEGDLKFRWLGLTVEAEFLWSLYLPDGVPAAPPSEAAETTRWTWYVQAGYIVLPDLLEIAARYDAFLLDDGVDDVNDRWGVGGVATLFLLRNRVKVQVEYMHRQESADPQIENDSVALQLQGRF